MFGNSSDGSASREGAPVGVEGVLGEVSEAELDAFVSKLRTDKNRIIPPAEPVRARPEWESERLHGGGRRPLIPCLPEDAAERHAWFVELDGKRSGPHEVSGLKALWERGELGPDSLCWREGFKAWVPVCQVPELTEALAPLPDGWLPESLNALDALEARVEAVPDGAEAPDFVLKGADALRFLAGDVLEPEPVTQVPLPEPEPVGTHAVVPLPVVAPAPAPHREERRERGLWLALVGGVMGGVTVALTLVLLLGWGGRTPLSRLFSVPGAADGASGFAASAGGVGMGAGASAAPGAGSAASATASGAGGAAVATAPGAAGTGTAFSPVAGPGGAASPFVQGAAGTGTALWPVAGPGGVAYSPVPGSGGVASTPGLSLGSAPLASGGGSVPVLAVSGGAVASSAAPPAPPSAPLETASLPERAPAPRPKVPAAALALEKRTAETPPAPKEISFPEPEADAAAAPEEEDELDLGPDEDFERELAEPPASIKAAKASGERTVFVPPAPGQPPVSLAQSDVFEVVLANKGDITACGGVQGHKEAGRVVVRWSILPSGKVDDVVMETSSVKGTPLAGCIEEKIRAWTFPKHQEQGAPVRFPFVF